MKNKNKNKNKSAILIVSLKIMKRVLILVSTEISCRDRVSKTGDTVEHRNNVRNWKLLRLSNYHHARRRLNSIVPVMEGR